MIHLLAMTLLWLNWAEISRSLIELSKLNFIQRDYRTKMVWNLNLPDGEEELYDRFSLHIFYYIYLINLSNQIYLQANQKLSPTLQMQKTKSISLSDCARIYNFNHMHPSQLCTYQSNGGACYVNIHFYKWPIGVNLDLQSQNFHWSSFSGRCW